MLELKKSLALLAGAGALLAFTPTASHAQDATTGAAAGPFADVPADHWAYNAVKTLQDAKIVIGYPDSTYGGRRPMTRYEFATAIARLLPLLNTTNTDVASKEDLAALRSDLESKLAANQAALDALTRLVNEFQPELQQLGQDVSAIQTRLSNLEGRVAAVEAEQQRLRITGDLNIIGYAANSTTRDGNIGNAYIPFANKNGVGLNGLGGGLGNTGGLPSNRFLENSAVYEDLLLHLRGRLSDTATAYVDLDTGNYLQAVSNTARAGEFGFGSVFSGDTTSFGTDRTFLYQAYLEAPVALGPLGGADVKIGRFGTQFTKWTLKQQDADIYTNLYQTDSGNIITDGGWLGFKLGPVGVQGFAGKFDETTQDYSQVYAGTNRFTTTGVSGTTNTGNLAYSDGVGGRTQVGSHPLGTFTSGSFVGEGFGNSSINNAAPVTQGAGFRAILGKPEGLVLGATVAQFALGQTITGVNSGGTGIPAGASDPADPQNGRLYNRVSVYGLDLNGGLPFALLGAKKGAITVSGAYTVSAEGANSGFNNVGNKDRYQSYEGMGGFNLGKLGVQAGYQFVGPYFSAPGYWGKIGAWTNPTNVKGPVYFLKYPVTTKLSLNADYEQYHAAYGNNEDGTLIFSPLQSKDHVNRYQIGLGYGLSSSYGVDLGYEREEYDLRNNNGTLNQSGKPVEDYITIGVGHDFNKNASFKLLYQIIHYNDHNTGFGGNFGATGSDSNYSGNQAVGQFSLKF